ncbi:shikimate dehydrogenase [Leucobacter weissii]|uniref:Shikimate dehydrogenase n=1 Tax=Leucobacter weissii TaxID=1983706 RepID=A0A939S700_9MICO|nr:shikimate dehydrogenase [Leucobacter weissii]MBO1900431.1 shikimate dehydrogenase [Leucobacter weissii]
MTLVGLLGEGIAESLTPPMHRREAEQLGLDYEYRVIDIAETGETLDELPRIMRRIREEGYDAINVTHPFKQLIIEHLGGLSPSAERLGAVNLVVFDGDDSIGHNTDWSGFRTAVDHGIGGLQRRSLVQVGAGGAGAATAYALLTLGVEQLCIADIQESRARALVERFRTAFPDSRLETAAMGGLDAVLAATDGVVHATPTGMELSPGLPFDLTALAPSAWVAEVVYLPLETELLREARRRGHRALDGGMMAVGQAADSLHVITGLEPDRDRMRRHFLELIAREERVDA